MRKLVLVFATIFFLDQTFVFAESPSLVGSDSSLRKQNTVADAEGLVRISNLKQLEQLKKAGRLVPLPLSVKADPRLDKNFRWVLQEASNFLETLGVKFIDKFGRFLQVNSAVRPIEYQRRLLLFNINAAPISGEKASPHLTGATIDIAKIGMSKDELEWVRQTLLSMEGANMVEATEEWQQLCFHVMVFGSYDRELLVKDIREP